MTPSCGNPQKAQRYPREWVHALHRMAAMDAEIMLPGHGVPVFGRDRIRQALLERPNGWSRSSRRPCDC
ncbi:hypothetical protein ACFPOI_31940 [Nonomuraea angiospora]|uniref:Glyoxylase-like metal-dependent hydrolase (Beta-lactamase superfamily II) n=1 Tax=Nonomuraea angiospora TaxID=46172 RepID=A0ABR9LT56_9ACTN|nr:hypothetical protein [Nonomuraea angiospora]MBE1583438.1 glyoxylase-like metal-dependent hydrolase (beta-lactamase superfamily II) [Nonomuraea angiospora]